MATPKTMDDAADTPLNESNLNKYISADGTAVQCKKWWGRVRYTGSAWEVVATVHASGLTSPALAWDTDHLVVTVSGYAQVPTVQVTQTTGVTPYVLQAAGIDVDEVHVYFYATAGTPGEQVTVQDTNMAFDLEITGT